MPFWFDHAFFLILAVLFPLRAIRSGMRRLRLAPDDSLPKVRVSVYRQAIVVQWTLVAIALVIWISAARPWKTLGVVPSPTLGLLVVAVLAGVVAAFTIRQRNAALRSDEALGDVRRRLRHVEIMLPHSAREARWFYRLSLTAGICEEVLYRGYLIWYLATWMPVLAAAAVASVIFGFGHAYQGPKGVLGVALFGAVLSAAYLISGSLLVPTIVHFLVDVHSGHLAWKAFGRIPVRHVPDVTATSAATTSTVTSSGTDALGGAVAARGAPGPLPRLSDSRSYDAIVVGLGAMGSAAAMHLARRGARVLGLDRFHPPHDRGSSHGETRLIREAYFEDPRYVPIVQRAFELWAELERDSGRTLIRQTGCLVLGRPDGELVRGVLLSAATHSLPYERLDADAVRSRFPGFEPSPDMVGILEPRGGMLFPEACIAAHLAAAASRGAELRFGEPVVSWRADGDGYEVETGAGRCRAGKLLLTAGPWIGDLLDGFALPLRVTRQTLFWFAPNGDAARFDPRRCPAYVFESTPNVIAYGFPMVDGAMKAALHVPGETTRPDQVRRDVDASEADALVDVLRRHLPDVPGRLLRAETCLYTNTPDGHFVVDFHPRHPGVLVASACSGHGFKFSSAMGEVYADLLLDGRSRFDLGLFGAGRLSWSA